MATDNSRYFIVEAKQNVTHTPTFALVCGLQAVCMVQGWAHKH